MAHQTDTENLLTPKELAEWLRISKQRVGQLVKAHQIPFRKLPTGKQSAVRFVRAEIKDWLQHNPHYPKPQGGAHGEQ
jgi:excisionase family DNA binding protein